MNPNPISQQHPINISTSPSSGDLLDGENHNEICVKLYKAALTGDRKAAEEKLNRNPELVRFSITTNYETILHVAVIGQSKSFIKYLLSLMTKEDLELQNADGQTALCLAAIEGDVDIAKLLLEMNEKVLDIRTNKGNTPLYMAALYGKHSMVEYLFKEVHDINCSVSTHEDWASIYLKCIEANEFGIALKIVKENPGLAKDVDALRVVARNRESFKGFKGAIYDIFKEVSSLGFYNGYQRILALEKPDQAQQFLKVISENITKLPKDEILRVATDPLFIAAEMGNNAFIENLIGEYPDLVREVNDNNQSIFHVAVLHRHVSIYMMLHEIGIAKDSIITLEDKNGNNMLHLVGILDKRAEHNLLQDVPGPIQQMRQEVSWFKEVEAMLPPSFREKKNNNGFTPRELFTERHRDLSSKAEDWSKQTSSQFMVVGALIATIAFAAAITFPGGYNQDNDSPDNGSPVLLSKVLFTAFLILCAVSFTYSCSSILAVLSILTSSFGEEDFLLNLPKRMTICIASLFYSILTMLMAFGINFFILYETKNYTIPVIVLILVILLPLLNLVRFMYPIVTTFALDYYTDGGFIFTRKKRTLKTYLVSILWDNITRSFQRIESRRTDG